jgi:hypothetical protein
MADSSSQSAEHLLHDDGTDHSATRDNAASRNSENSTDISGAGSSPSGAAPSMAKVRLVSSGNVKSDALSSAPLPTSDPELSASAQDRCRDLLQKKGEDVLHRDLLSRNSSAVASATDGDISSRAPPEVSPASWTVAPMPHGSLYGWPPAPMAGMWRHSSGPEQVYSPASLAQIASPLVYNVPYSFGYAHSDGSVVQSSVRGSSVPVPSPSGNISSSTVEAQMSAMMTQMSKLMEQMSQQQKNFDKFTSHFGQELASLQMEVRQSRAAPSGGGNGFRTIVMVLKTTMMITTQ